MRQLLRIGRTFRLLLQDRFKVALGRLHCLNVSFVDMKYKLGLSHEGAISPIPETGPVGAVIEGGRWLCFKGHFG